MPNWEESKRNYGGWRVELFLHAESAGDGVVGRANSRFEIEGGDSPLRLRGLRWSVGVPISKQRRRRRRRFLLLLNPTPTPTPCPWWEPPLHLFDSNRIKDLSNLTRLIVPLSPFVFYGLLTSTTTQIRSDRHLTKWKLGIERNGNGNGVPELEVVYSRIITLVSCMLPITIYHSPPTALHSNPSKLISYHFPIN